MANGRKLNEVTNVSTLASSDRLVSVRTADGHTVQISLTDFMNTLPAGSIITATVGDEQITDAKLEKRAALSVMGNATNATGAPADITAGSDNTVLKRDGNNLVFDKTKAADIDMSDLINSLITGGHVVNCYGWVNASGVSQVFGPLAFTSTRIEQGVFEVYPPSGYRFRAFAAVPSANAARFVSTGGLAVGTTITVRVYSGSANPSDTAFNFIGVVVPT